MSAACYQGTFDMPTTKKERRNPLLIKQNRYLHYLNEEFVNGAGRRDNVEDDDDINEMERCMSHFDKVLEEQSTHPINETKLPYKQRIEGRITGQTDRDESLSKGIKKDGGRFVMQRHDLDEYKSFRETYGEGEESYHDIQDKWDDLDIKQARIKYEQENDAKILMSTAVWYRKYVVGCVECCAIRSVIHATFAADTIDHVGHVINQKDHVTTIIEVITRQV